MTGASALLGLALAYALSWRWSEARRQQKQRASGSTGADAVATAATAAAAVDAAPRVAAPLSFSLRFVAAPMVGQSDLAFRLLCRQYGATAAYTPMLYAERFCDDEAYRAAVVDFGPAAIGAELASRDSPLVVQFAATQVDPFVRAALLASSLGASAVCLNLGCPQDRAREGGYGSYLTRRRDWVRVAGMVRGAHDAGVVVVAKIRLLQSVAETVQFALLLQDAGLSALVVHGRGRGSSRRRREGAADLLAVAQVVQALRIPVVSNGNTASLGDALQNLRTTAAQGVMSAEGLLANHRMFAQPPQDGEEEKANCVELATEYLDFCLTCPTPPLRWMADHVHNLCRAAIAAHRCSDIRTQLKAVGRESSAAVTDSVFADPNTLEAGMKTIRSIVAELDRRMQAGSSSAPPSAAAAAPSDAQLPLPPAVVAVEEEAEDDEGWQMLFEHSS